MKLTDYHADPSYAELNERTESLKTDLASLEEDARVYAAARDEAQVACRDAQARALLKEIQEAELDAARKRLDTQTRLFEKAAEKRDAAAFALGLLNEQRPRITADAKARCSAPIAREYARALKKLRTAIEAAIEANEVLAEIAQVAARNEMSGLAAFVWPDLRRPKPGYGNMQSRVSWWLHQTEEWLKTNG